MDPLSLFLGAAWGWFSFLTFLLGPVLIGFWVAWYASPRQLRQAAAATAVLLGLCLLEFFFPLNVESIGPLALWFKSIIFFFELLTFAVGLASGNLIKQIHHHSKDK